LLFLRPYRDREVRVPGKLPYEDDEDNAKRRRHAPDDVFLRLWLRKAYTMRITLWAAMIVGTALWGYGLFVTGTPPLIDWKSNAPWWIADYLPNMESELGLVLVCLGSLAPYWPRQRQGPPPPR